jgi:hypothetical protein
LFNIKELVEKLAQIDFQFGLTQALEKSPAEIPIETVNKHLVGYKHRLFTCVALGYGLISQKSSSYWPRKRIEALSKWIDTFLLCLEDEGFQGFIVQKEEEFLLLYTETLAELGESKYYDESHVSFCRKIGSARTEKKAVAVRESRNTWVKNGKVKKVKNNK